jgi:hypothetical protein
VTACLLTAGSAFATGGACPSGAGYLTSAGNLSALSSFGVTSCYYIAANGSDSNSGTSTSSPWAHAPGMPSCTGNCAAITPAAGEGFIFRGGDSWDRSNFGMNWSWPGTSGHRIYLGVDSTWFSGSAWTRPIFDCGGTNCGGGNMVTLNETNAARTAGAPYVTLDDIEFKGMFTTNTSGAAPSHIQACAPDDVIMRVYIHGWSHAAGMTANPVLNGINMGCGAPQGVAGSSIHDNVIDGSDTSKDMLFGIDGNMVNVYDNYVAYVNTGIDGSFDTAHDNLVEYLQPCLFGCHQDGIYQQGPSYDMSHSLEYNNVVRHSTWSTSGGAVKLWYMGNIGSDYTGTGYVFNNVLYDNLAGNLFDSMGHNAINYGKLYVFNNSIQSGTDSAPGGDPISGDNGNRGGTAVIDQYGNHLISSASSTFNCNHFTCSADHDLLQTLSVANGEGYFDTSTYALEPPASCTASTCSTVGAGLNEQALCTAIAAFDPVAGKACQKDTTYACAYNESKHTVSCPARNPAPRPNGAWDVGAYQAAGGSAGTGAGGAAGAAGTSGSGGSITSGGTGGSLSAGGSAGSSISAGGSTAGTSSTAGGSAGANGANTSGNSGSCGCTAPGRKPVGSGALALLSWLGLVVLRRRRARLRIQATVRS